MKQSIAASSLLDALAAQPPTTLRRYVPRATPRAGVPIHSVRDRVAVVAQHDTALLPRPGILSGSKRIDVIGRVAGILKDAAFEGLAVDLLAVLAHLDGSSPLDSKVSLERAQALRDDAIPQDVQEAAVTLAWRLAEPYLPIAPQGWRSEVPASGGTIAGNVVCPLGVSADSASWLLDVGDGLMIVEQSAFADLTLIYRLPWGEAAPARPDAVLALRIDARGAIAIVDPDLLEVRDDGPVTRPVSAPDVLLPAAFTATGTTLAVSALGTPGVAALPAAFDYCSVPILVEDAGCARLPAEEPATLQAIALCAALGRAGDVDPNLRAESKGSSGQTLALGAVTAYVDDGGVVLAPANDSPTDVVRLRVGGIETHRADGTIEGMWHTSWHREDDALLLERWIDSTFCLLAIPREDAQTLMAAALLEYGEPQEGEDALDVRPGTKIAVSDVAWRSLSFRIAEPKLAKLATPGTPPAAPAARG